ncbi:hypothetical protein EYF80_025817 [Liparis tanakae]|uniref:Uncharacterized protein n=1 Tax=Liparis tanakae TaxID=230148 RepID=A0A4Z2HFA5_9TELE|nr:hypothetical protein EYF80_025817 [Liparis tanakae]
MIERNKENKVVEGEQAGVLSQQIGAELSSAQRQEDARQGNPLLRPDLKHGGKEGPGSRSERRRYGSRCTLKVTPARAKALKSPRVPSTALRTKPSLLALMLYCRSLCSGPTLRGRSHTESDSGLHLRRVEEQFLGGGRHCDLLSSPVQSYGRRYDIITWVRDSPTPLNIVLGQLVRLLLDGRALVPGAAAVRLLLGGAALSLLAPQLDLLQLLLLPLLLQAAQGPEHQRRLALDGRPEGRKEKKRVRTGRFFSEPTVAAAPRSSPYLMVTVTSSILSVVMSPVM